MKWLLISFALLVSHVSYAQRIFVAKTPSETKIHVYITRFINQADLIVYRTNIINQSKDTGKWFFVDAKSKSDWIIYYTPHINESTLIIYFTNNISIAGYQPNKRKIQ